MATSRLKCKYNQTFLISKILQNFLVFLPQFQNASAKYYCTQSIKTDKVLVVSKMSKYQFEKRKYKNLTDKQLGHLLRNRGSDFENMIYHHDLHKKFEDYVVCTLKDMGIKFEIVDRYSATEKHVKNSDLILPLGGDGTFLLAASMVNDNQKPVIGFNSNPSRSEGYLCLPKKYSTNIRGAIERLQSGKFEWLMRSRIRTTLIVSNSANFVPSYLHDVDSNPLTVNLPRMGSSGEKVLPYLALNEVFIGETLSARVSHLRMKLNGSDQNTNLKCSGICFSTGTGSTSWHMSINRMPVQNVLELLELLNMKSTTEKTNLATTLSDNYNKNLVFPPDEQSIAYTIRELISAGVWPDPKGIQPRGFASKIEVKSNCVDASLVIDGGVSYCFNDGTAALLEIKPEDALRTVIFRD